MSKAWLTMPADEGFCTALNEEQPSKGFVCRSDVDTVNFSAQTNNWAATMHMIDLEGSGSFMQRKGQELEVLSTEPIHRFGLVAEVGGDQTVYPVTLIHVPSCAAAKEWCPNGVKSLAGLRVQDRTCRSSTCSEADAAHCCATSVERWIGSSMPPAEGKDFFLATLFIAALIVCIFLSLSMLYVAHRKASGSQRDLMVDPERPDSMSPLVFARDPSTPVHSSEQQRMCQHVTPQWALYTVSQDGRHRHVTPLLPGQAPPAGVPVFDRPLPWGGL